MNLNKTIQKIEEALKNAYDKREANSIAYMLLQEIFACSKLDLLMNSHSLKFEKEQQQTLDKYLQRLQKNEPIQYVLGKADFYGMNLAVNDAVLIPRPETEELVAFILEEKKKIEEAKNEQNNNLSVLDIGTGSGCIALALKKENPTFEAFATDVSQKALAVAKKNAEKENLKVSFLQADILKEIDWNKFSKYDIIVSNPPYITVEESSMMTENVLEYEPHLALFVSENESALLFYDTIARFALEKLKKNGRLFFEINENYANECVVLLEKKGFHCELKRDINGKFRMIKSFIPNN
ncbi:MAG: peptide chain release factor N(5)-glutamine methyltransferase [Chitinophagales bacterium]